ncbi:MAG: nodulation protein NfeD [Chloroflexota bacterium]
MSRVIRYLFLSVLFLTGTLATPVQADAAGIDVLRVSGTVNPVMVDYIRRGIKQAENDNAIACIIQLDTPGGLDTSMRDIVKDIVSAAVPIVVYVSPSGARAASAGTFITIAAHVAAMAPNTSIGAASPITLSPEGEGEISSTLKEKILNDAASYIRSLAQAKGRNLEWAERAVREAASASDQEALELNVIDMVAPNLTTLIARLDGREVTMLDGSKVTLETQGTVINYIDMTAFESLLFTVADPNIAYILLSIAVLGIALEIFNPALIFPGIIGVISGILAFYALGMLPVNYAGVLFILIAFGLFIAEMLTASFGILISGGIVSLILGSLILFKGDSPFFRVNPWLIAAVVLTFAAALFFIAGKVIASQRRHATTGKEGLIGQIARTRTILEPEGLVFYGGELWKAISESGRIEAGEQVLIDRIDGLILHVTKRQ